MFKLLFWNNIYLKNGIINFHNKHKCRKKPILEWYNKYIKHTTIKLIILTIAIRLKNAIVKHKNNSLNIKY
jgi:hypothetical protein